MLPQHIRRPPLVPPDLFSSLLRTLEHLRRLIELPWLRQSPLFCLIAISVLLDSTTAALSNAHQPSSSISSSSRLSGFRRSSSSSIEISGFSVVIDVWWEYSVVCSPASREGLARNKNTIVLAKIIQFVCDRFFVYSFDWLVDMRIFKALRWFDAVFL